MANIIDRLEKYMYYKGLNNNKITVQAGLSVGLIGKSRETRKGLHSDSIEKILYTYSDLDAKWLLTGIGEMLVNYTGSPSPPVLAENPLKYETVNCKHCKDKDEIIKSQHSTIQALQKTIETQADYIETLKEISPGSSSGQKRKAS